MHHALLDSGPFSDPTWQMAYGERVAVEGLLSASRPALAVETGTAEGGSLRRIAAYAEEVHCFDIDPRITAVVASVPGAHAHVGDSAETLPAALASFAAAGRHVDFALVDGDHSAEGVERDARALLDSDACVNTTIVFHDAANQEVRRGLEAVGLAEHPKVTACLLDFIPGYVVAPGSPRAGEVWNGLALVVLAEEPRPDALLQWPPREPVTGIYADWLAIRGAR